MTVYCVYERPGVSVSFASALAASMTRERQAKAVEHAKDEPRLAQLKLLSEADRIKWALSASADDARSHHAGLAMAPFITKSSYLYVDH